MKTPNPKNQIVHLEPRLKGLEKEKTLDLNLSVLSEIDGDNDIYAAHFFVKINGNGIESNKPVVEISRDHLIKLYEDSSANRENDQNVLALRFLFGIENDKIILIYQPVELKPTSEFIDAMHQKHGFFAENDLKYQYSYNSSSGFTQLKSASILPDNYREGIRLRRTKRDEFKRHDIATDVKSVLYSFQEIFAVIYDSYSTVIDIYNCVRRVDNSRGVYEMKHSLVLAAENTRPFIQAAGNESKELAPLAMLEKFTNQYANLAHLCPPNCPGTPIVYPIE